MTNRLKILASMSMSMSITLAACNTASAVIVLGGEGRNLSAPTGPLLTPWNLQGQFSLFAATPIGPSHFVAARHIGGGVGQAFTYSGQNYATTAFSDIAGTDLRVWTIDTAGGTRTLPTWASLWNPTLDGSEIGKPLVVFGRGTPRGEAIYAPIFPGNTANSPGLTNITPTGGGENLPGLLTGPNPSGQGDLRGWKWAAYDVKLSWGTNTVDSIYQDPDYGQLITYSFDQNAGPNEAILSQNDSSGGVFAQTASGAWKLIGVNLGVDTGWSYMPDSGYFNAAVFDARGLYIGTAADHQLLPFTNDPLAASSYSTRIGGYYGQLATLTDNFSGTGGAYLLPEPMSIGSLLLLGTIARRRRVTT